MLKTHLAVSYFEGKNNATPKSLYTSHLYMKTSHDGAQFQLTSFQTSTTI